METQQCADTVRVWVCMPYMTPWVTAFRLVLGAVDNRAGLKEGSHSAMIKITLCHCNSPLFFTLYTQLTEHFSYAMFTALVVCCYDFYIKMLPRKAPLFVLALMCCNHLAGARRIARCLDPDVGDNARLCL